MAQTTRSSFTLRGSSSSGRWSGTRTTRPGRCPTGIAQLLLVKLKNIYIYKCREKEREMWFTVGKSHQSRFRTSSFSLCKSFFYFYGWAPSRKCIYSHHQSNGNSLSIWDVVHNHLGVGHPSELFNWFSFSLLFVVRRMEVSGVEIGPPGLPGWRRLLFGQIGPGRRFRRPQRSLHLHSHQHRWLQLQGSQRQCHLR